MLQVSSDMSTMDFDLPSAISLSAAATTDVFIIISVMASVTWPVLIVAIPTVIVAKYIQVELHTCTKTFVSFCLMDKRNVMLIFNGFN